MEQELDMACKHLQRERGRWGADTEWCSVCGAIKKSEDNNWTFPQSHMLVLNLISGASMAAVSLLENEMLPKAKLKRITMKALEAIEAFTGWKRYGEGEENG